MPASVLNILNKAGIALKSFPPPPPVSEVEDNENVESSQDSVSRGGVQEGLGRGLPVMPPSDVSGSTLSFSPASTVSEVEGNENVEGSHDTVSCGGVLDGLGLGLPVMPPSDVSGIPLFSPASTVSE